MRKKSVIVTIIVTAIAILLSVTFCTGCHNEIATSTISGNVSGANENAGADEDADSDEECSHSTVPESEITSKPEEPGDSDISTDDTNSEYEEPPWYTVDETDDPQELKSYHKILADLPLNDVNSVSSAIDKYRELAGSDKTLNDRLFRCFEGFYNDVIWKLDIQNEGVIEDDETELFKMNGIEQYSSEAGPFIWRKPGFLYDQFASTTSDPQREWLKIKKDEEIQKGYTYLIEDALLVISWNNLSDRIIVWEKFMNDYGEYEPFDEYAQSSIEYYLWLYMNAPYKGMLTFPYMYDETGEDELKLSYERFIKKYPASKYQPLIKGYYDILIKSDFEINEEAIEYLKMNGIDTNE